jgi:hypothetical protein
MSINSFFEASTRQERCRASPPESLLYFAEELARELPRIDVAFARRKSHRDRGAHARGNTSPPTRYLAYGSTLASAALKEIEGCDLFK